MGKLAITLLVITLALLIANLAFSFFLLKEINNLKVSLSWKIDEVDSAIHNLNQEIDDLGPLIEDSMFDF